MNLNYNQPNFLFCEIQPKIGTWEDNRIWIYHRLSLSLIEFVCLNSIHDFEFYGIQKDFIYHGNDNVDPEAWIGIYVQNNTKVFELDEIEILNNAWQYLEKYFNRKYSL